MNARAVIESVPIEQYRGVRVRFGTFDQINAVAADKALRYAMAREEALNFAEARRAFPFGADDRPVVRGRLDGVWWLQRHYMNSPCACCGPQQQGQQ